MGKTNLERQQALRAKRDKEGWKRFEIWTLIENWPRIKRFVDRLNKREKQS